MTNQELWALFTRSHGQDIYYHLEDPSRYKKILTEWSAIENYTLPCQWAHTLTWWQVVQVMLRTGCYDDTLRETLSQRPEKEYPLWPVHRPIPYQGWDFIESIGHERPELLAYVALNYMNHEWRTFAPAFMSDYFKLATVWMLYRKIGVPGSIFYFLSKEIQPMRHKMLEEYTEKQLRLYHTMMMDIGNGFFDRHPERVVSYMVQAVADDVITIMPYNAIPKINQSRR